MNIRIIAGMFLAAALSSPVGAKDWKPYTGPRVCYLTFDDGPLKGTAEVLAVSRKLGIPVTMLMVGSMVDSGRPQRRDFEDAMREPLVMVGNHSYSHAPKGYKKYYSDIAGVLGDIDRNQRELKLDNKVVRLPGRNFWLVGDRSRYEGSPGIEAALKLGAAGYAVIGWDMEWYHDARTGEPLQSVGGLRRAVIRMMARSFTPGHVVVLAHDEMFVNAGEDGKLYGLLRGLRKEGCEFRTLRDYPGVPASAK